MPSVATEGVGHTAAGDLVEVATGRPDPVPTEFDLADSQPSAAKLGLAEPGDDEITPMRPLLQLQAGASFRSEQILGRDQGDLAAVGRAPVAGVGGITVPDEPATDERLGRFESLHPGARVLGDVDADQLRRPALAE